MLFPSKQKAWFSCTNSNSHNLIRRNKEWREFGKELGEKTVIWLGYHLHRFINRYGIFSCHNSFKSYKKLETFVVCSNIKLSHTIPTFCNTYISILMSLQPSMYAFMLLQVIQVTEWFSAYVTRIWMYSSMYTLMSF